MRDHSDEFLTTKQLAAMLHVKERKIYDLVVYGRFCKNAGGAGSWYAGDVDLT